MLDGEHMYLEFCFDLLFCFVLVNICPGLIPEPQWYGLACSNNASTAEVASNSCNRVGWSFFFCLYYWVTFASETALKLKITLTCASRSCLHIKNSSLSSQLYYNSVHCNIQNLQWVNITIGVNPALVNIPQRLLRFNLTLQGAGQPDHQKLGEKL